VSGQAGRSGAFARIAAEGAAFLLLLQLLAVPAGAAGEQKALRPDELGRQPIEITADRLSADSARESVSFERLFAEYSRPVRAIEKITAEGNVRVIQGTKEARAARAIFYNLEQRIVLTGGADLVQGENVLKGDTVTIYLRENRSVVTSGRSSTRKACWKPGKRKAVEVPGCPRPAETIS